MRPQRTSLVVILACPLAISLVVNVAAQEWVAHYNGPGNRTDFATALDVDGSGNVYVTGLSEGDSTDSDYATIKYSPNGHALWVSRYNGPGNRTDFASALAVDDSGNVYVAGTSAGSDSSSNYATIKYSPTGATVWVRRYVGPFSGNDIASALVVDDSGNVYVTGQSKGSSASKYYATIKYSPTGDMLWVSRYVGPANRSDFATALAVDDSGNVYTTGRSFGSGTASDYATIKYSPAGHTLWVSRYNGPGNRTDFASALAVDDSGNVFVTGRSEGGNTDFDYATIKYAPTGDALWTSRYNGPGNGSDFAFSLAVDDNGSVYVTGESTGNATEPHYATIKYLSNGDVAWVRRYNGPGDGHDLALDVVVDDSGNEYVTGVSTGSGTGDDYATIKYSPTGDTLWLRRYNGPGNDADLAFALAVDASGNVYVTGESRGSIAGSDYATIKYVNPVGDVLCDGVIDLSDVVSFGNYLDGLIDLTGTCGGGQADVDQDGDIDENDYNLLYDVGVGVGP